MSSSIRDVDGLKGKRKLSIIIKKLSKFCPASREKNVNEIPENSVSFIDVALSNFTDNSKQTVATLQSISFELFLNHSINIASRYESELLKFSRFIFPRCFRSFIIFYFLLNSINKQNFVVKSLREVC